jgi:hypothetical protein
MGPGGVKEPFPGLGAEAGKPRLGGARIAQKAVYMRSHRPLKRGLGRHSGAEHGNGCDRYQKNKRMFNHYTPLQGLFSRQF